MLPGFPVRKECRSQTTRCGASPGSPASPSAQRNSEPVLERLNRARAGGRDAVDTAGVEAMAHLLMRRSVCGPTS